VATKLFETTDVSGQITTAVFQDQLPDPKAHCDIEVLVDQDMVVVGGGASANDLPGALLTASYPNEQRTGWRASS
jgi:cation diffusion facilitator CzcD-associated flavoprotein CzcO